MTPLPQNWAEGRNPPAPSPIEAPKLRIGDLAFPLVLPAIFALDACLAWHEMLWHIYRSSLDFHPFYMVSLGAGALVSGLWIAGCGA